MRFGILGPLEVVDVGGRRLAIGGRKPSATLRDPDRAPGRAGLRGAAGRRAVGRARAGDLRQDRAGIHLQAAQGAWQRPASHAREGYALSLDPEQLDADRFERLGAEGREALGSGDPVTADKRLREALGLWRGEPLADFRYEPFAQAEIARLQEARLTSLEDRIDADLALGRHNELVAELEALTRAQPRRERLRGQLMLALYRSGRQLDALETFRLARHALIEELGIEPGRQLRELHQAILEQHPRLDVPGATRAPSATQATSISPTHLRADTLTQDPSLARRALTSGSDTSAATEAVDTETAATADVHVSPQDASASAAAVASVDRPAGSRADVRS